MTYAEIQNAPVMQDQAGEARVKGRQYAKTNQLYRFALFLTFIPLGLDFKDRGYIDNSLTFQIIVVALFALGFFLSISANNMPLSTMLAHKRVIRFILLWSFFTAHIVLIAIIRGGDLFLTARVGVPYVMMIMSMLLAWRHMRSNVDPVTFFIPIIIASVISMFWTYYIGRFSSAYFSDDDFSFIEDIRYTILSAALPPLFGWSIYYISKNRRVVFYSIIMSFILFITLISKTRGTLLGELSAIPVILLISASRIRIALRLAVPIIIGAAVSILFPTFIRNYDVLSIWKIRFFGTDEMVVDETYQARLAEYWGQLNMLFSDVQSAIFGYGPIASTYNDARIIDNLNSFGVNIDYYSVGGVGVHSTWINSLFHGGLLIGWVPSLTATFIVAILLRVASLKKETRRQFPENGKIALMMSVPFLFPMSIASIFTDRIGPTIFGIATVWAIFEWTRFKSGVLDARAPT